MKQSDSKPRVFCLLIDYLYCLTIFLLALGVFYFSMDAVRPQRFAELKLVYPTFVDFFNYLVAGEVAASPYRLHPYDFKMQHDFVAAHLSGTSLKFFPFVYLSPIVFPVMMLFARLPENIAFGCYLAANVVIFIAGMAALSFLRPDTRYRRWWHLFWYLFATLGSVVAFRGITLGQPEGLLAGSLAMAIWALLTKKDFFAGLMLAVSTIKPHFTVFFIAAIPALARWRALVIFVICELAFLILPVFLIGFEAIMQFPAGCFTGDMAMALPHEMINFRALISPLFTPKTTIVIAAIVEFCVLTATFFLLRPAQFADEKRMKWLLAVACVAAVSINIHAHLYDCIFLAPAALLTLPACSPSKMLQDSIGPERLWRLILLIYPIACWLPIFFSFGAGHMTVVPYQIINLVLLGLGLAVICRQKPVPEWKI